jgi:hypothetical protein
VRGCAGNVLLLAGWLLLRPPFARNQQGQYDLYADQLPLSRWEQVGSFALEGDCEQNREAERERAERELDAAANDHVRDPTTGLSTYDAKLAQYYRALFARCLAADYVRHPK